MNSDRAAKLKAMSEDVRIGGKGEDMDIRIRIVGKGDDKDIRIVKR